jgi:hypothetical protein
MASNKLTPQQDLLTREFYIEVAEKADDLLPDTAAHGRHLRAILLALLNYDQLPNGAFISKGQSVKLDYGSRDFSGYPDEWQADYDFAVAAIALESANETTDDQDTSEAGTSESPESSEVR